jgi:epoxyqueuosine reductase
MTPEERERLRARIAGLGFDEVRFTSVGQAPAGRFEEWLAQGHHADMAWLERGAAARLDPTRVVSELRTVVALGVNYLPEGRAGTQGRWSKYSLYRDYHDTIGKALRRIGDVLEKDYGQTRDDYRAYVDTGPVLERGWAARAGMGWQGKNAMHISRTHGNWLFLAVVLTRMEIPPDAALPGVASAPREIEGQYCGSCVRCLEACPTRAFPRPGIVDARRCIAYHTIENRGIVPRELRRAFGGRVFGCDTCLDVCPWNRFARAGRSVLLEARAKLVDATLLDLLGMNATRFADVFRGTPIKRAKLAGLLRNACIAAGNWDDTSDWHFGGVQRAEVVAAVERLCAHESEVVRAHAVWALRRLCVEAARRVEGALRAGETAQCVHEEYEAPSE